MTKKSRCYSCELTENGLHTGELENILDDHASGGKHAHTAVLELGFTEPADIDKTADAEGIEADVTSLF